MRSLLFMLIALLPTLATADTLPITYDRVSFTEEAATDVENDLLVAVMYVQREGTRADLLAGEVNRLIDRAVEQVKNIDGIKLQTQSYRTTAVYKNSEISGWRVHQSIRLESRDSQLLGNTLGELQQFLNVQSISYQISDEQRREHTAALIELALQRFQQRASAISKTLAKQGFRIVRIAVNSGQGNPVPLRAEAMMAGSARSLAAPPRIEAGTQRLSVSVSGEIELLD